VETSDKREGTAMPSLFVYTSKNSSKGYTVNISVVKSNPEK